MPYVIRGVNFASGCQILFGERSFWLTWPFRKLRRRMNLAWSCSMFKGMLFCPVKKRVGRSSVRISCSVLSNCVCLPSLKKVHLFIGVMLRLPARWMETWFQVLSLEGARGLAVQSFVVCEMYWVAGCLLCCLVNNSVNLFNMLINSI